MGRFSRVAGTLALLFAATPETAKSEFIFRNALTSKDIKKTTYNGNIKTERDDWIGTLIYGFGNQTGSGLRVLGNFGWGGYVKDTTAYNSNGSIYPYGSFYSSSDRFGGLLTLGRGLVDKHNGARLNFDFSGGFIGRKPILSFDVSTNLGGVLHDEEDLDMDLLLGAGFTRYLGSNQVTGVIGLRF